MRSSYRGRVRSTDHARPSANHQTLWRHDDGGKLTVESYRLFPIDDTIAGEIDKFKDTVTEVVFASRGYCVDHPLAVARRDIPNTYSDIAAGNSRSMSAPPRFGR